MSDQIVELLLRLTLDGQGRSQMRSGLADMKASLAHLRSEADKTRQAINDALSKGDAEGAKRLRGELDYLEGQLKDIDDAAQGMGDRLMQAAKESSQRMRELAERLQNVGRTIGIAGGVALAGMAKSANDYAQRMGTMESTSQQWLATSRRLEQANVRLGRASAQALQPWYDRLAQITNMAASFAEKNPNSVAGLATAALAAVGTGGVLETAGQGIRLVADIKLLTAAALFKSSADTNLKAAGLQAISAKSMLVTFGAVAAVIAGAVAIFKLSEGAGKAAAKGGSVTDAGKAIGGASFLVNPITAPFGAAGMAAGFIGEKFTSGKLDSIPGVEALRKQLDDLGLAANNTAQTVEELAKSWDQTSDAYKLYAQTLQAEREAKRTYEKQRSQIEREGEQERTRIVQELGAQRTQLEAQYAAQVSQANKKHNTEMQRMAQDHFRAMRDLQAQYERDTQQAEQQYQQQQASLATGLNDQLASLQQNFQSSMESLRREHLRRLQQMEEDHNARVDDLVGARDALGLAAENRNYARQKKAEQQAYNDQIADLRRQLREQTAAARDEYRKQLAELQRSFAEQQKQRDAEYERQKQQADEQYAIQRSRAEADFKDRMAQMADQHSAEMRESARQFAEQMRQSRDNQRQKLQELQRSYQEESRQRIDALTTQTKELLGIQQTGQTESLASAKQYWADLVAEQKAATGQSPTPSQGGGRASGGYASYGRYKLGEVGEEFVLTNATTRAMEAAVGGRLTQERLLMQIVASRRRAVSESRGQNVTIHANYQFSGTLGAAEKDWIRRASYESAQQGLLDALGG